MLEKKVPATHEGKCMLLCMHKEFGVVSILETNNNLVKEWKKWMKIKVSRAVISEIFPS